VSVVISIVVSSGLIRRVYRHSFLGVGGSVCRPGVLA
jgi:hypothetical protein